MEDQSKGWKNNANHHLLEHCDVSESGKWKTRKQQ